MKKKINFVCMIVVLAMLILPTGNVFAQSPDGDVVLFGQNYTLKSEDTLDGSLAVIGGNAKIEEDATINGDVVLIGGNLTIDGDVNGDVALIGGNLTVTGNIVGNIVIIGGQALLTETAVVDGDIATIGGNLEKEPGAEVTGNTTNNAPPLINIPDVPGVPPIPNIPNIPNVPNTPNPPNINFDVNPLANMTGKIGQAVLVALIGMLLTLFLQPQLERAGDAMVNQPFVAGGYGLLVFIVVPIAIVIMTLTLILIPVALVVAFIIPLAWLFGMVALGQEVGERFTKAINQTWAPVLSTGFGTFLLMLVVGFIGMIPCIGWLPSFLVTLIAIGGVGMTWFGTRSARSIVSQPVVEAPPAA